MPPLVKAYGSRQLCLTNPDIQVTIQQYSLELYIFSFWPYLHIRKSLMSQARRPESVELSKKSRQDLVVYLENANGSYTTASLRGTQWSGIITG